jgi:hypothetical protein
MDELFIALSQNRFARDDVTLGHVIMHSDDDILKKYVEFSDVMIRVLKLKYMMKDFCD